MSKPSVYTPLLILICDAEGTDPPEGVGYNETLAYGALTDGPVDLVGMSLTEVDRLQTDMLRHPKNRWNSSAVGRYQIVRTTKRSIEKRLALPGTEKFDEAMQDRMGRYLLGFRGVDEWLAGRMTARTFVNNLAKEWASLPVYDTGKSYYSNQRARASVSSVLETMDEVRERYEGAGTGSDDQITQIIERMERANGLQKEASDKLEEASALHFEVLRELRNLETGQE